MFPKPYPGESFYSVLCRYHVRSCNKDSRYTLLQLFGAPYNVGATLLTQYLLNEVSRWIPGDSAITPNGMLMYNTAFPLLKTNMNARHVQEHLQVSGIGRPVGYRGYKGINRYRKVLMSTSCRLRFCPECARQQMQLYGESYWQILPQVKGVEFCPDHKCRIISTILTIDDIQRKFIPASEAISDSQYACAESGEWNNLILHHEDFFIRMADSIKWIFDHPQYTGNRDALCLCYCKALEIRHYLNYLWCFDKLENRIHIAMPEDLATFMITENAKCCPSRADIQPKEYIVLNTIPFYLHVMNMLCITRSAEHFYRTVRQYTTSEAVSKALFIYDHNY